MAAQTSRKSKGGFTLIEVMVSLLIMMVGMIGLLQALGIAFEHNLRNQLREESVYMGEKYMSELRGKAFDAISTISPGPGYTPMTVASGLRGGGGSYTVERKATPLTADRTIYQLEVTVKYTYKGVQFQNRVVSPITKPAS